MVDAFLNFAQSNASAHVFEGRFSGTRHVRIMGGWGLHWPLVSPVTRVTSDAGYLEYEVVLARLVEFMCCRRV